MKTNAPPIPLTPEILTASGFVNLNHLGKLEPTLYINENIQLHAVVGDDFLRIFVTISEDNYDENINIGSFSVGYPLSHIQYLHQLQNLYLSLTGEELKLNEL